MYTQCIVSSWPLDINHMLVSIVAADALVLEHQVISIYNTHSVSNGLMLFWMWIHPGSKIHFEVKWKGTFTKYITVVLQHQSVHTAQCPYKAVNFLQNPHQTHPIRASYGMPFLRLNSYSYSTSFTAAIHAASCYIWQSYNSTSEVTTKPLIIGSCACPSVPISTSQFWDHRHGNPDSKVHGTHMGPTWGRQDPGRPHVGPMNLLSGNDAVNSTGISH